MKNIVLTIALLLAFGLAAQAQRDAFVTWDDNDAGWNRLDDNGIIFTLPSMHGSITDDNAPLGSGLLVLTALGMGYAARKKRRN